MKLKADTVDEYIAQLKLFLATDEARALNGIVYFWKTEKPIPRVRGSSPIIYIGKSINSFRGRYNKSKSISIEREYFEPYYKYLMKAYGAISIKIQEVKNPELHEWDEIYKYNSEHLEFPPLNRTSPRKPRNSQR